jgi:hypothetical protein
MDKNEQALRIKQEFLREHLPFYLNADFSACYAHKLYPWQRDFLLSRNRLNFLTAGNQLGKSAVSILRCINQSTRQDLWPFWFAKRRPTAFCYLYPEAKNLTVEFAEKWTKVYLAKGKLKSDPYWGWIDEYNEKKQIDRIVFASGVTVYFRTYSMQPKYLQAHTFDAVFFDEEPPQAHFDEMQVRTQMTAALGAGYTTAVFTATLGQKYLFDCMEMQGKSSETFVGAWKRQISAYDCLKYCDGSPSEIWTLDYIEKELKPRYRSKLEMEKRLMGRFVRTEGLTFEEFDSVENTEPYGELDLSGWRSFVGIDFGTGGEFGHSSAIVHVKIDPTYSKARVVLVWSSKKRRMTQSDLLLKYKAIAAEMGPHICYADWHATDFFTLAARENVRIAKAEKDHAIGENLLNTLFKERQLKILTGGPGDAASLIYELQSLVRDKSKTHAIDDCADALRYAISQVPMRLTALKLIEKKKQEDLSKMNPRLAFYKGLTMRDDPMQQKDPEDEYDYEKELDDAIELFERLI